MWIPRQSSHGLLSYQPEGEGGKVIKNIGKKTNVVEEEVTLSNAGLRGGFEKDDRKSRGKSGVGMLLVKSDLW